MQGGQRTVAVLGVLVDFHASTPVVTCTDPPTIGLTIRHRSCWLVCDIEAEAVCRHVAFLCRFDR